MDSIPWIIGAFVLGAWFGFLVCAIINVGKRGDIDDDY